MYKDKSIGVVVPAYNENGLIVDTLKGMPSFVDTIIVVDDASTDRTNRQIRDLMKKDKRILLLVHKENKGLGKTLIDGYLKARALEIDVVAVMAGDNQMDPVDLEAVVSPVAKEDVSYVKGNRLFHYERRNMPTYRFWGNSFLTFLTKFATGYWRLVDPQCGYTAISREALAAIPIGKMTKRYGYNADILNMLNIQNFKVRDVSVRPVYGKEKSKIKLFNYVIKVSLLIKKLFLRRLWKKHVLYEFHPMTLFYFLGFVNLLVAVASLVYILLNLASAPQTSVIIFYFSLMLGVFSFFFGMWLDMDENKRLWG